MRLIDANELMEHVWRDRLDSREAIAEMVNNAPTVRNTTWVSVKDRLPEEDGYYLVVAVIRVRGKTKIWRSRLVLPYSKFFKAFSTFKPIKFAERCEIQKVTHWLELPPMPKEDNDING